MSSRDFGILGFWGFGCLRTMRGENWIFLRDFGKWRRILGLFVGIWVGWGN
ncbi:unnamed protein product [Moneuplotes crassus]|uniref:Uncharacterized protein n=1 Tax=Euplotes crassus TaxID=5936 RepID=A0AAD1UDM3_EUPCR|nr:unnamed protein product [Moneuplotes crassus]